MERIVRGRPSRIALAGAVAAAALVGSSAGGAETLETASGYRLQFEFIPARGKAQPLAVIYMHGKNGRPDPLRGFAQSVAGAGFAVYLPWMPWSARWDGTMADAVAALDALVALAARDGTKVVVGGHSQGAAVAMLWRPADPPPAVVGKVFTGPGGLLDLVGPYSPAGRALKEHVEKARALEAAGKGKERTRLSAINTSGARQIEETYDTTPEIFLSFHDRERFPGAAQALRATTLPVFWAAGLKDPIPSGKRSTFAMIPANPESVFVEPDADHSTVLAKATEDIIAWLGRRVPR